MSGYYCGPGFGGCKGHIRSDCMPLVLSKISSSGAGLLFISNVRIPVECTATTI